MDLSSNTDNIWKKKLSEYIIQTGDGVVQLVYYLTKNWTTGRSRFDARQRQEDYSCNLCVQTGCGAHPASCPMGTVVPFPGGKARQGRDSDYSLHLVPRS
jgi:hypothetical protein